MNLLVAGVGLLLLVGHLDRDSALGYLGFAMCSFVGVLQLLYVVPMARWARREGYTHFLKGVIIVAMLTLLLNTAGWMYLRR